MYDSKICDLSTYVHGVLRSLYEKKLHLVMGNYKKILVLYIYIWYPPTGDGNSSNGGCLGL